jgi:hypothetical protein
MKSGDEITIDRERASEIQLGYNRIAAAAVIDLEKPTYTLKSSWLEATVNQQADETLKISGHQDCTLQVMVKAYQLRALEWLFKVSEGKIDAATAPAQSFAKEAIRAGYFTEEDVGQAIATDAHYRTQAPNLDAPLENPIFPRPAPSAQLIELRKYFDIYE